jgi:hypothetical protein
MRRSPWKLRREEAQTPQAKPYQVRQFLRLVERYNLSLQEDS